MPTQAPSQLLSIYLLHVCDTNTCTPPHLVARPSQEKNALLLNLVEGRTDAEREPLHQRIDRKTPPPSQVLSTARTAATSFAPGIESPSLPQYSRPMRKNRSRPARIRILAIRALSAHRDGPCRCPCQAEGTHPNIPIPIRGSRRTRCPSTQCDCARTPDEMIRPMRR